MQEMNAVNSCVRAFEDFENLYKAESKNIATKPTFVAVRGKVSEQL